MSAKETADILAGEFASIDDFKSATLEQLSSIEGIGEIIAQSIYDYFKDENNLKLLDDLKQVGVNPVSKLTPKSDKLAGKIFVLTGTLQKYDKR